MEFENDQLGARMRDESQVGIKVEIEYVPLQSNEMFEISQIIQLEQYLKNHRLQIWKHWAMSSSFVG